MSLSYIFGAKVLTLQGKMQKKGMKYKKDGILCTKSKENT